MKFQLAKETDLKSLIYPLAGEPKLDGVRIISVVGERGVKMFTRNGKTYPSLDIIKTSLTGLRPGIYDGEVMAKNWNETVSILKSSNRIEESYKLIYNVFDYLSSEKDTRKYLDRKSLLKLVIDGVYKNIKYVKYSTLTSDSETHEFLKDCLDKGYEGIMLKNIDAPYTANRNSNWLKYKPTQTKDATIVGIRRGQGKFKHTLGCLLVKCGDEIAGIGTGFTMKERNNIFKNRKSLIGSTVEMKVQDTEVSKFRFPVFIRLRPDK